MGVTLPEELPVEEVLELERDLPAAAERALDLIVVDGEYPDRFTDEEAERLQSLARRRPHPSLAAALAHDRRARRQAAHVRRLWEEAAAPVLTLPFLFVARLKPRGYERLARALSRGSA